LFGNASQDELNSFILNPFEIVKPDIKTIELALENTWNVVYCPSLIYGGENCQLERIIEELPNRVYSILTSSTGFNQYVHVANVAEFYLNLVGAKSLNKNQYFIAENEGYSPSEFGKLLLDYKWVDSLKEESEIDFVNLYGKIGLDVQSLNLKLPVSKLFKESKTVKKHITKRRNETRHSQKALIVIDPQIGFCCSKGSLAKVKGEDQMLNIYKVKESLLKELSEFSRKHLVYSEYTQGQFTNGKLEEEMSDLCVPNLNKDCEVIPELKGVKFDSVSLKNEQSALSSLDFCELIKEEIVFCVKEFVIAGFLIDHCVRATALDLKRILKDYSIKITVDMSLCASRVEKYDNGTVHFVINELSKVGIGCLK
jgi:nicotinamidase-related amidase